MDIVTDEINVNRQAWTTKQGQCTTANQNQFGVEWDTLSQLLQDE